MVSATSAASSRDRLPSSRVDEREPLEYLRVLESHRGIDPVTTAREVPAIASWTVAFLTAVAATILLQGCAETVDVSTKAERSEVQRLGRDIAELRQSVQQIRGQLERIPSQAEQQLRAQAATTEQELAAQRRRAEAMNDTLTAIASRLEQIDARVDMLARMVTALRLSESKPPPRRPPTPSDTRASGEPGKLPSPSARPADVYTAANDELRKGHHLEAIARFQDFLRRYPRDPQAASAQLSIAEAYWVLARAHDTAGRRDQAREARLQAVREFKSVLGNYPKSDKVPTAVYREAQLLIELRDTAQAKGLLQYVITNYPAAPETRLAREQLQSLK